MCLLSELYASLGPVAREHEMLELSMASRQELLMLVVVAPLMLTDLKTPMCPNMFCTDASPSGGGVVSGHVGQEVAVELWRRKAIRGGHTRLASQWEIAHRTRDYGEDDGFAAAAGYASVDSPGIEWTHLAEVGHNFLSAGLENLATGWCVSVCQGDRLSVMDDETFVWLLDA
eukprot:1105809-Amphidinium_carterae.1